jgi:phosphoglucosamine mutase
VEPDGLNINDGVGSTEPDALIRAVAEHKADLGIALDGDGDRVLLVDADGRVLDGDILLYIIAADRKHRLGYGGGVVGTQMSNLGLELAIKNLSMPFIRARVGDRYVLESLKQHGWLIGGESSGHILCLDRHTTGDGIIAALQVLAAMRHEQKSLRELASAVRIYPQTLVNVRTEQKIDLDDPRMNAAIRQVELAMGGAGRVLLRASGTEPLIRVMVEGEDSAQVALFAQDLAEVVREIAAC